jgi:hypothetical protein
MKKVIILAVLLTFYGVASAQGDTACIKEINEAVWKPFVAHLVSGDKKSFAALHSSGITRVEIDRNRVQDFNQYFPPPLENDNKDNKRKMEFELRFDKRICNGIRAWETGYYKGTILQEGKSPRSYYGRFMVVLQKEAGTWKILVDADTGKDATENTFSAASPME